MRNATMCVALLCFALGLCSGVAGDDLYSPPWTRGIQGATNQQWTFSTSAIYALPEIKYNPYGQPYADVLMPASRWFDMTFVVPNMRGIWAMTACCPGMDMHIPVCPDMPAGSTVETWIQVTYAVNNQMLYGKPTIEFGSPATLEDEAFYTVVTTPPTLFPNSWCLWRSKWSVTPVDGRISFRLDHDPNLRAAIDQVVVDTLCVPKDVVPEPSGLIALTSGLAAAAVFRRSRAS